MKRGRRWFLGAAALAAAGIAGAALSFGSIRRTVGRWLPSSRSKDPFEEETIAVLSAIARVVLGDARADVARYEEMFRSRAAEAQEKKAVYAKIALAFDAVADREHGERFVDLGRKEQRQIIDSMMPGPGKQSAIPEQERRVFDAFVLQPILGMFMITDAWIALGYESWPGRARGFDGLRAPPPGARDPR